MSSLRFPLRLAVLIAAGAGISACDISGLGVGNRPEKLEIIRDSRVALVDSTNNTFYRCINDRLQAVLTFSNGAIDASELLNERVTWRSSDPSVVEISNADVLIPGSEDEAFGYGVVVPRGLGTATITAEFVGFTTDYEIEIADIDSIEINQSSLKLAPETSSFLSLTAKVDGYELSVTERPVWEFETEDEDVAVISPTTGIVAGVGVGGPLTAKAKFVLCPDDPRFSNLKATVTVEPLTGLQLAREFSSAPNNELIVGTTDSLTVTGKFADDSTIDLAGQVRLESTDSTIVGASLVFPSTVSAAKAGTAQVKAVYGGDDSNDAEDDTDPPEIQSNSLTFNAVEGELQDFSIAPLNQTITALGRQQFTAMGTFSVAGATRAQPITRAVSWRLLTLDDKSTSAAAFLTSSSAVGTVVSASPEAGAFKITGTVKIDDEDVVKNTVLCVKKPNTPTAACPPPEEEEEAP